MYAVCSTCWDLVNELTITTHMQAHGLGDDPSGWTLAAWPDGEAALVHPWFVST